MPNTAFLRLIEVAEDQLDRQTKTLQQINQAQQNAQLQLSTLHQYREDYTLRLQQTSQSGVSMANYHNFYRFIGTLDQAISQQNGVVAQLEEKAAQQQQHWLEAKQRLNAYQTLQQRRDNEVLEQRARQEQRLNDELSAAMFYRTHLAN